MNLETKQNLASQLETAASALREQAITKAMEAIDCNGPQFTKHFRWKILQNGNYLCCYGTPKTDSGRDLLEIHGLSIVRRILYNHLVSSGFDTFVHHQMSELVIQVGKKEAGHFFQSLEMDISNREELVASLDKKIADLEAEANVLTEIVSNI